MSDIKIKPAMPSPKARQTVAAPKEATDILRKDYEKAGDQRRPKGAEPVHYATDSVEEYGSREAALGGKDAVRLAVGTYRLARKGVQRVKETKPKEEHEPAAEPPQTASRQTAPEQPSQGERTGTRRGKTTARATSNTSQRGTVETPRLGGSSTAESRQGEQSYVRKRHLRKAINNALRKRKDARRDVDAEISRSDAAPRTAQNLPKSGDAAAEQAPAPKERRSVGRRLLAGSAKTARRSGRRLARRLSQKARRRRREGESANAAAADSFADTGKQAVKVISRVAVKGLLSVFGVGGSVILLIYMLLVAAVVASPFGILFANEATPPDAVPLSAAIAQINYDFNARLEELQDADTYDNITVEGSTADWIEVLAVFAAKVAGSDGEDAADVVTMDADRIERLKAVFWDMNELASEVETIEHTDSDLSDGDDSWTERNLTITLTPRTAADMPSVYGFSSQQTEAMTELLAERAMLTELVGSLTAYNVEASEVLRRLPSDLSAERRAVVETACSLVGKVTYFWGGKSLVLGWDSRWGTLQKVWADGNSTSGTYRPYGLDCSGFVDWVFYNATDGAYYPGHGGGATMQHRDCSPILWADAMPGDLVFYPGDSHVGIVGGRDEDDELLIIHCASSTNGTVVTGVRGFTSIGRPTFYGGH